MRGMIHPTEAIYILLSYRKKSVSEHEATRLYPSSKSLMNRTALLAVHLDLRISGSISWTFFFLPFPLISLVTVYFLPRILFQPQSG